MIQNIVGHGATQNDGLGIEQVFDNRNGGRQRLHGLFRERHGDTRRFVKLCHRLDRETSGVILIGKHPRAHSELMQQFENRQVEKEYLAIVRGHPAEDEGLMDLPIGPDRGGEIRLKMAITPKGLPSQTRWRVLERRIAGAYGPVALVSCLPKTGRQHQIRVHMDALGHPLVGDKLYGVDPSYFLRGAAGELDAADLRKLGLPRHALHAHRLRLKAGHGISRLEILAPLPPDLTTLAQRLGLSLQGTV